MEVTISTAILLIATIIMATVFTGAALSELYSFQNTFKEVSSRNQEIFDSSIIIIGETSQSSPSSIEVWVKNVGQTTFSIEGSNPNSWDIFVTFPSGVYQHFAYGGSPTNQSNCWDVQILNDGGTIGLWENGETIQLTIYTSPIPTGVYAIQLTLPNGVSAQDKFSL